MPSDPPFHPVIVAPTFNNDRTLKDLLRQLDLLSLPVIVVNDGSLDTTAEILDSWAMESDRHEVLTHEGNRGKAAALRTAFARAAQGGYTHAITIDTDGQLDPAEIPNLIRSAAEVPTALVVGFRDAAAPDYPKASRVGRYWANVGVLWNSAARIIDSQCGFRVYPLKFLATLKCRADRYGYETEVLARYAWAGLPIRQVEVSCSYRVPEGRVTHYRPWKDSIAAGRMHVALLLRSCLPIPTPRYGDEGTGTVWHRFITWISPVRAWSAVRTDPAQRSRFATAFAIGVFIANLPLYGVQTLISLYAARKLRLNPLATVAGSHLSTPPVGALLIAGAIALGHRILHGTWPVLRNFDPSVEGYRVLIRSVMWEWLVGSVLLGTLLAVAAYVITWSLLQWLPLRKPVVAETNRAAPVPDRDSAGRQ
jgi:uncharacterized protein (DUF2062 family)